MIGGYTLFNYSPFISSINLSILIINFILLITTLFINPGFPSLGLSLPIDNEYQKFFLEEIIVKYAELCKGIEKLLIVRFVDFVWKVMIIIASF